MVEVTRDGKLLTYQFGLTEFGFYTTPSHVWYCIGSFDAATRADYYFWFARRLLAWAYHCFDPWFAFMAVLTARRALSEIVLLASSMLHELAHITLKTRTNNHCEVRSFLNPYPKKRNCCFDWNAEDLYSRLLAKYGLPPAEGRNPFATDSPGWQHSSYAGCGIENFLHTTRQRCLLELDRFSDQHVFLRQPCHDGLGDLHATYNFGNASCGPQI